MKKPTLALAASILSMSVNTAHADATLQFSVTTGKQSPAKVQTVFVQGGKFLVQAAGGDKNVDLLYNRVNDTMYIIDHQRKSYMIFDEKAVAKLGQAAAMMSAVQRQLAEQMKNMPPEQQARMREMLGGMAAPAAAAKQTGPRSVKKLGNKTVGGFSCQQMAVYRGAKKYSEMCVANPDAVGLSVDDMKTVKALQAFQERVWTQASKISSQMGGHMPEFGGKNIAGVPIEMRDFVGPAPSTMTVTKANAGVGGKALGLPKGYKAQSLPDMGGGRPMPGGMRR